MGDPAILDRVYRVIQSRKGADAANSHVARLFAKGRAKIAQKVGEEGVEAALAGVAGSDDELVGEAADLIFHLFILLAERDIEPAAVWAELEAREGKSGVEEKASRPHI
ncbi:phosphoribosyl-ATP diphosphatase [Zavarzinia compransoris]|uniref:phosphoribosyl-ATP diphosphatase n=1 Tax=Zavarzinia marina TaxID=2911065 RepID=UPI001F35F34F|nr:phosphoribosyl-ATP diphosphatase [Zavarzinia marina]MCF4167520.1 phosphoribosyl-ATP diphosphatase [Zavarzinia marina]